MGMNEQVMTLMEETLRDLNRATQRIERHFWTNLLRRLTNPPGVLCWCGKGADCTTPACVIAREALRAHEDSGDAMDPSRNGEGEGEHP